MKTNDLAVNGNDIMEELKLDKGPAIGIILEFLLEAVLDDPGLNERTELLKIASNFYREYLENSGETVT